MLPILASRLGRSGAALAFALALPLAAPAPAQAQSHTCDRSMMGQVLSPTKGNIIGSLGGAALGGLVGNQFGSGAGKGLMTGVGVIGGALAGGYVGRSMEGPDQACVHNSLEQVPTGQTSTWRNPNNGAQYNVTPTRNYRGAAGQPCRDFVSTAIIDGREQQVEGTACRQPDGSWKTVSNGDTSSMAVSPATILRVQQRLRQEGFYVQNNIDGKWGPKTSAALANFQRVKGLPATGEIDQQSLVALDLAPAAAPAGTPTAGSPPPGAQQTAYGAPQQQAAQPVWAPPTDAGSAPAPAR
jgi:surface antigen